MTARASSQFKSRAPDGSIERYSPLTIEGYKGRSKRWLRHARKEDLDPRRPSIAQLVAYFRALASPVEARTDAQAIAWYFRSEGVPVLVDDPEVTAAIDGLDSQPQDDPLGQPLETWPMPYRRRALRMASGAYSPLTRAGYALRARQWIAWAQGRGVDPLLPGLDVLVSFFENELAPRLAAQTVANWMHSLSHYFRKGGAPDIARDPRIRLLVERLKRAHPPADWPAIRVADVRAMLRELNNRTPCDIRNGLLLVVLCLGGLALRHICALDVSRRREEEDGIVFFTDVPFMREVKIFECGDPDLSVKKWFARWHAIIGDEPGPLFPASYHGSVFGHKPISREAINIIAKRLARRAGVNCGKVCSTAFRKGFVLKVTRELGPVAAADAAGYARPAGVIYGYGRAMPSTREVRLRNLSRRGKWSVTQRPRGPRGDAQ